MPRSPSPLAALQASPAALPALVAVGVFIAWAASHGGYPTSTWYPGAIFLLGLFVATVVVLPNSLREIPRTVLAAGACLLGFTAWSFLSIIWADAPAEAWDGANRTLLFLVVFCLFAAWGQRSTGAGLVLGTWTLGIIVLAVVTLIRVSDAADPTEHLVAFRLAPPAGYASATAAIFLMAVWPALVLAGRPEVPWPLRGLFAGGATVLVNVATLTQSRGAIYALPVVLILFFVVLPGRRRTFAVTAVVAAALALTLPEAFQAALDMRDGQDPGEALREVARPTVIAALAVLAVVAAGAGIETSVRLSARTERAIGWAVGGLGLLTAVAVAVTGLVLAGNPADRVETAWNQFKDAKPVIVPRTGSRLSAGLGSNRYDAYRVALNRFADRPLTGIGADNFAKDYLLYRRSEENLRYPHSLEMRTLSQTGVPGTVLLLGTFGFALAAAVRAMRSRRRLRAAVAGGSTMVFLYWLVQGSVDWFWEFAGMGAVAFAMLGLACSLAPRRREPERTTQPLVRGWAAAGAGALALAAAVSFVLPWLAERDVRRAARGWPINLGVAYDRLDRAESMNPLSDRPALIEGSIALRIGDFERAERAFNRALERDPGGVYAHLELGAIASERGRRADALRHLERAAALTPRDQIVRSALRRVRSGRRLSIAQLNNAIISRANALER